MGALRFFPVLQYDRKFSNVNLPVQLHLPINGEVSMTKGKSLIPKNVKTKYLHPCPPSFWRPCPTYGGRAISEKEFHWALQWSDAWRLLPKRKFL